MLDKNVFIINSNQKLAFSSIFAKTQRSSRVFLPGCSLASLGTQIVQDTLKLLQKAMPDIALSSFCCGKPSTHINGGKDFPKRLEKLEESLKNNGVKQIVTACPNCYNLLEEVLKEIEVISIWKVLDDIIQEGEVDYKGRSFIVHDPCTTRNLPLEHEAIRNILAKMNINVIEFKHSKSKTICCGQKNMLMVLDKPKAMKVLQHRVKQSDNYEIVSYCAACVEGFRSVDKPAYHILELILKIEGKYSWKNRLAFAQKLKL